MTLLQAATQIEVGGCELETKELSNLCVTVRLSKQTHRMHALLNVVLLSHKTFNLSNKLFIYHLFLRMFH